MNHLPSPSIRCNLLLKEWRNNLVLTNREKTQLKGELLSLDKQLKRLGERRLRVVAFGRVGVGKSSLLNALVGQEIFTTDVAHGCTRVQKVYRWNQKIKNINAVDLVDTPGIDEIAAQGRARLATRIASQADLILFILDSDLTKVELMALEQLLAIGKPILLTLNRSDQWSEKQKNEIMSSILKRLPPEARNLKLISIAAAPRKAVVSATGHIRSQKTAPRIKSLKQELAEILTTQGDYLLTINTLKQADHFYHSLKRLRLNYNKINAQGLIGKFATIKASGLAANPLLLLDLAGGIACDTALVIELSKLYGIEMRGATARQFIKKISSYNSLIGGIQIAIQLLLSLFKHFLFLATPFTAGFSLGPTGPIALAQAALAIHTTRVMGRLTAKELIIDSHRKESQPRTMLQLLTNNDPELKQWLYQCPASPFEKPQELKTLLP